MISRVLWSFVLFFIRWETMLVWWDNLGCLPDAHQTALLLPLLNRTGGENEMQKLMVRDKDEITCQVVSLAK